MENVTCFRCKVPIKGIFNVVRGRFLGPGCFKLYEKRNRIRAQVPAEKQTSVEYITTDICDCDCLDCIYFNRPKCPQEEAYKGILGRRR